MQIYCYEKMVSHVMGRALNERVALCALSRTRVVHARVWNSFGLPWYRNHASRWDPAKEETREKGMESGIGFPWRASTADTTSPIIRPAVLPSVCTT